MAHRMIAWVLLAAPLSLIGCSGRPAAPAPTPHLGSVQRPAGCTEVAADTPLQQALDGAADGAALCLAPGSYAGPVVVRRGQTLYGPRAAVIRSSGQGTTVSLLGKEARLLGVTVDGSGGRYDKMDAGVHVEGEDLLVEGVRVQHGMFGILVDRSQRVTLRGNEVFGKGELAMGMRGDGIRFWEVKDSTIEDNTVFQARDVVIRYSPRGRIRRNWVSGGRYGLHLMYSNDAVLEDNRSVRNVVGTFVMYSRNVMLRRNVLAAAAGSAGIGLGAKESGNLTVTDNLLIGNTVGVYLDTTPLYVDDANVFSHNAIRLSDTGIIFHSSQRHNTFQGQQPPGQPPAGAGRRRWRRDAGDLGRQ